MATTRVYPLVDNRSPSPSRINDQPDQAWQIRLDRSRTIASELVSRVKERDAPLRVGFVARQVEDSKSTPLGLLVRGGRGGEVRLKILLSLIWVAVQAPHDVSLAARVWAELIGLDDPTGNGARRANAAFKWLVENDFLEAERRPGAATQLSLRNESLNGKPYQVPGALITRLKNSGKPFNDHLYVKVPKELWTNGWIVALSGPGLAMLLVLLVHARGRQEDVWLSPGWANKRYMISDDTRRRGVRDLESLGLVTIRSRVMSRGSLDVPRRRNVYVLNHEVLVSSRPVSA